MGEKGRFGILSSHSDANNNDDNNDVILKWVFGNSKCVKCDIFLQNNKNNNGNN